jgi:hypothetical protein
LNADVNIGFETGDQEITGTKREVGASAPFAPNASSQDKGATLKCKHLIAQILGLPQTREEIQT